MLKRVAILFFAIFSGPAFAQNYTATQGTGTTFGSKLVGGVNYPQIVFCDPTTPSQCVAVNASGQMTIASIVGALPAGANTIGAVTQASGPWTNNVTQFGGSAVVTGTGVGGSGIPRVTVSNDSSLAPNQSVNTSQVNAVTVLTGAGATGTGSQRVTAAQDTTTIAGSAPGTAGTPSTQVISVQGVASGTPQPMNGTSSNASSGVATSATNVPSISYNYGWNGTTWDQLKGKAASTQTAFTDTAIVADPRPNSAATISGTATNPATSAYTLTATTTAYTAGQLIANNATAGSVNNPSFSIQNSAGGAVISRLRLVSNDTTSTAWAGQTVQVDLWNAAPTWTNGDRGTWLPATGSASHLASFTCAFPSAEWGDGLTAECPIAYGNFLTVTLASGTTIYASYKAVTGSGVTGVSKTFTLTAEELN